MDSDSANDILGSSLFLWFELLPDYWSTYSTYSTTLVSLIISALPASSPFTNLLDSVLYASII